MPAGSVARSASGCASEISAPDQNAPAIVVVSIVIANRERLSAGIRIGATATAAGAGSGVEKRGMSVNTAGVSLLIASSSMFNVSGASRGGTAVAHRNLEHAEASKGRERTANRRVAIGVKDFHRRATLDLNEKPIGVEGSIES